MSLSECFWKFDGFFISECWSYPLFTISGVIFFIGFIFAIRYIVKRNRRNAAAHDEGMPIPVQFHVTV